MKNIVLFGCLLIGHLAFPQLTGRQSYEKLGISFTIPDGWFGQETNEGLILASNTMAGFMLLATHNYSLAQLKQDAQKGINEGNGTVLQLATPIETLSPNAIGGLFEGTMEYQPAKAYSISVVNPYETGPGVTIAAITTSEMYNQEYEKLCKSIFNSLKFTKVDRTSELSEWKQWLSNVRLTYMDSYYSSSYTDGGVSGGYSTERKIDLCSRGYFNYGNYSDVSVSGAGVSGYSQGNTDGQGKWEIKIGESGDPELFLNFYNGEVYNYHLEYKEEKLFMNGDRYFRTTEGEYAPNCN